MKSLYSYERQDIRGNRKNQINTIKWKKRTNLCNFTASMNLIWCLSNYPITILIRRQIIVALK